MPQKYLMKGNEAIAQAAILAGCRQFFGYPITPQTEISAYMAKEMPKCGGVFLQAESEIAAVHMLLGAVSTGSRAMTSSSSLGISLKTEGLSYLAGSDLPALVVNIQRGGPGLGGIQPSQADYFQATKAPGHGDFHLLVYAPASVQEMVDFVGLAFDKSEQYRVPAMILADGLLGQMMEPITFPDPVTEFVHQKPWATTGTQNKRPPNIINSLYLRPSQLEGIIKERFERYRVIEQNEVLVEQYCTENAEIVVVAYGATARVVRSAVEMAREQGLAVGMVRPKTVWPFPTQTIAQIAKQVASLLVVEMSMGQMVEDVRLAACGACDVSFFGRTGGIVPTPPEVLREIKQLLESKTREISLL